MTQNPDSDSDSSTAKSTTRRAMIAGVAGLGAAGLFAGSASAQASGDVGTSTNPYLKAYIDRKVYVGRTTDPSSPADGTEWYRSDL